MSEWWDDNDRVKPKSSEQICPCATFSTTNLTWTDPVSAVEKRAANRRSYGPNIPLGQPICRPYTSVFSTDEKRGAPWTLLHSLVLTNYFPPDVPNIAWPTAYLCARAWKDAEADIHKSFILADFKFLSFLKLISIDVTAVLFQL
jgi:hypothetical protein